jgi:cyanophycin synthetase
MWFAADAGLPLIAGHRAAGGRAVVVIDGWVTAVEGAEEVRLGEVAAIRRAVGPDNGLHVENVLAAAGAAWALDVPLALIRTAIDTYVRERMNGTAEAVAG